MIRKAIFTYWCDHREKTNGGFSREQDLGVTLALALELAKKQFEKVELITNTSGKELLIDKFKLPFTKVLVDLDQFDNTLHPDFWAYAKVYAYSIQDEPFVHIDNDVFIWDTIPEAVLQSDLFFQNKEHIDVHTGYNHTIGIARKFPVINAEILNTNVAYAYNCGVVGANDLELIAEWHAIVRQYLFSQENQQTWTETADKHSQNHLFEQYFISALIALKKDKQVVTLLKDDFMKSAVRDFKYTHLWGEVKREQAMMQRVRKRLFKEYPEYKERIAFATDHSEVFEEIYSKELWGTGLGSGAGSDITLNKPYIAFLQSFLEEFSIKTVIDFGCGDWQFSRSIDWSNIHYSGVDCVDSVIQANKKAYEKENIRFATIKTFDIEESSADLILIKDVFIHWPNEQILRFIEELRRSNIKYALITNQVDSYDLNSDIEVGEFRNVDLNKAPFNCNLQEIFKWPNDTKITYLLQNA